MSGLQVFGGFHLPSLCSILLKNIANLSFNSSTARSITRGCLTSAIPGSIANLQNLTLLELTDPGPYACDQVTTGATRLHPGIASLSNLVVLRLVLRTLTGTIPDALGSMHALRELVIATPQRSGQTSSITGALPASFLTMPKIEKAHFLETDLVRVQSTRVGDAHLPSLMELSFAKSSSFAGPITTADLKSATGLKVLDFSNTLLQTPIGDLLPSVPSLVSLNIAQTPLKWNLSRTDWSVVPALSYLSVAHCSHVSGTIGSSISALTELTYLDVSYTGIAGTIPPEITACPLKSLLVAATALEHPIPESIGDLAPTLVNLQISGLNGQGTIPESFGKLVNLTTIDLSYSGFRGTIPAGVANFSTLFSFVVANNALTGDVPAIEGLALFDVHNNQLTGTLPRSIGATAFHIYAGHNELGPDLDPDMFADNENLAHLHLSHNLFSGRLPRLSKTNRNVRDIDLSHNFFYGGIDADYCGIYSLKLDSNLLSGSLTPVLDNNCAAFVHLSISHNQFTQFPDMIANSNIFRKLDISNNRFVGDLPMLPTTMEHFSAGSNHFQADNIEKWAALARVGRLTHLDISNNEIVTTLPFVNLIGPYLTYLSVAGDQFQGIPPGHQDTYPSLASLDISDNHLAGSSFSVANQFPNLIDLKLARNSFSGDLSVPTSIAHLDIAFNRFEFDVARVRLPLLISISAAYNLLHGSLTLENYPNLQVGDFSGNELDNKPDLVALGQQFSKGPLIMLNITDNPLLPPIRNLSTSTTGLSRSLLSSPSKVYPDTVTCYQLSFGNQSGRSFIFDENLFDYQQCDCNSDHFGYPPLNCHPCPLHQSSCGATQVTIPPNRYAYLVRLTQTAKEPLSRGKGLSTLMTASVAWISDLFSGIFPNDEALAYQIDMTGYRLESETCVVDIDQIFADRTDCKGISITAQDLLVSRQNITELLNSQCQNGSEGRLCSRCKCNHLGGGPCFFRSGPTCRECRVVAPFALAITIPFLTDLFFLCVFSPIMAVIIHSKRSFSEVPFEELHCCRRLLERVSYIFTLGYVPILVSFLPMIAEFTDEHKFVYVKWIWGLFNSGSWTRCLMPYLSIPAVSLAFSLALPGIVVVNIWISSYIADWLIALWVERKERKEMERMERMPTQIFATPLAVTADTTDPTVPLILNDGGSDLGDVEPVLNIPLPPPPKIHPLRYTSKMLASFMSSMTLKFLYFSSSLSAWHYIFRETQTGTGDHYVKNEPWMPYRSAVPPQVVSAFGIVTFVAIIPGFFLWLCWKMRNRSHERRELYYGPVFCHYRDTHPHFWFEIIKLARNVLVAFFLQLFPSTDAWQAFSVVSVLVVYAAYQIHTQPWKLDRANQADSLSNFLLIGNYVATRPTQLEHGIMVSYFAFGAAIVFILTLLFLICWTAATTEDTDHHRLYQKVLDNLPLDEETSAEEETTSLRGSTASGIPISSYASADPKEGPSLLPSSSIAPRHRFTRSKDSKGSKESKDSKESADSDSEMSLLSSLANPAGENAAADLTGAQQDLAFNPHDEESAEEDDLATTSAFGSSDSVEDRSN